MLRTSLKYQNIISRAELWRYTITDILAGGIWSDLSSCLYPPVYWRVISDRYQFPSLLGRYTDTSAATGSGSVRWRCLCSRWLHNIRYQSGPGHGLTDQRIFTICQTDCWLLTADCWLDQEVIISLVAFQESTLEIQSQDPLSLSRALCPLATALVIFK